MQLTWLGWAGAELEADDATVVVDPLDDAGAVFAPLGELSAGTPLPEVVAASAGRAVAGLVTHLHRDHADAAALAAALAPGAPVLEPPAGGGDAVEGLALAQAEHELAAAGLDRRRVEPWESVTAGPFTLTALPATDGVGDPQVAWLVEADGVRVLHLGDTMFHG
jgi:L-ascorbate metabolism protein UlaG (beta-lactamase superfamily)